MNFSKEKKIQQIQCPTLRKQTHKQNPPQKTKYTLSSSYDESSESLTKQFPNHMSPLDNISQY